MSILNKEEGFIDHLFMNRVDFVLDDRLLQDEDLSDAWEAYKKLESDRDLSELERLVKNFTKADFAVAVLVALEKYPFMVLQCVAEHLVNKERKKLK